MKTNNTAACALVFNSDGKVLVVSRPGYTNQFGLPGGSCEIFETADRTALRELQEETGFIGTNPILVFKDWCKGEVDFFTYTYLIEIVNHGPVRLEDQEKGVVFHWANFSKILTDSPFSYYNVELAKTLLRVPHYRKLINDKIARRLAIHIFQYYNNKYSSLVYQNI